MARAKPKVTPEVAPEITTEDVVTTPEGAVAEATPELPEVVAPSLPEVAKEEPKATSTPSKYKQVKLPSGLVVEYR